MAMVPVLPDLLIFQEELEIWLWGEISFFFLMLAIDSITVKAHERAKKTT